MKNVNIFNDVLGSVMRGPSSSHTAGSYQICQLVQNLFEMEYTYKKAMDSILGQREMVLFERIIICGWHNSTRTVAIK